MLDADSDMLRTKYLATMALLLIWEGIALAAPRLARFLDHKRLARVVADWQLGHCGKGDNLEKSDIERVRPAADSV